MQIFIYNPTVAERDCRYRLMARTAPSHGANGSPILPSGTIKKELPKGSFLSFFGILYAGGYGPLILHSNQCCKVEALS
jgi:hypothetical protein